MGHSPSIPNEATQTVRILREQFAGTLEAVYLHGSAVAGGLWPDSDVDVLAVASRPMTRAAGIRLRDTMLQISGYPRGGGLRPIELIVFTSDGLAAAPYPARCEFLYGEWLRGSFEAGETPQPVCDPELTLVLAQAREDAFSLFGPSVCSLLPLIPQTDVRRALGDMLPTLCASLEGDKRNVLLTLARMWRTATEGDFVSKDAAATWAAARLREEQATVLLKARDAYLGLQKDKWSARRDEVQRTVEFLRESAASALALTL